MNNKYNKLEKGVWHPGNLLNEKKVLDYIKGNADHQVNTARLVFDFVLEKDSNEINEENCMYNPQIKDFCDFWKKPFKKKFEGYKIKEFKVYFDNIVSQLDQLMDDDIPIVKNHENVRELEQRNGRGFWGNPTTGYIYDEDQAKIIE